MLTFICILFVVVLAEVWYINRLLDRVRKLEDAPLDNRARDANGRYVKDNPKTRTNEAYKSRI
jgi:hypothetical protein